MLTTEAANRCGLRAGGKMAARVSRFRGGKTEQVEVHLRVIDVLDPRAGSLPRVYAPLSFVLDVESYKEGYGAPERGWAGQTPDPYPSFDGAVLLLQESLFPIARTGLIINTGFGRIYDLSEKKVSERLGFSLPSGLAAYDLAAPGASVTASNIEAIDHKLRGREKLLLPYAGGIHLVSDGEVQRPIGLSMDDAQGAMLGLGPLPGGGLRERICSRMADCCRYCGRKTNHRQKAGASTSPSREWMGSYPFA